MAWVHSTLSSANAGRFRTELPPPRRHPAYRPTFGATVLDPPYGNLGPLAGPGVPAITPQDRVYVGRYRERLLGVLQVPAFSLAPGVNLISGTETPVVADKTLAVTVDIDSAVARVNSLPGNETYEYWELNAVSESPYNFPLGPKLAAGGFFQTDRVDIAFGNPFAPERQPLFMWQVYRSRAENDPDPNVPTWFHYTGFYSYDRTPMSGRRYLDDVGRPTAISLNGVPLSIDKQTLAIPQTQPIELSFVPDRPDGSFRYIDCYRYDLNPKRLTFVLHTRVLGTSVQLPARVLPRGPRYHCRAHLANGVPNASAGDDLTRDSLYRIGYYDSPSFIVQ